MRFFVWDDVKALEVHSGDDYTTLWIYLMTVNCILKHGQNGKKEANVYNTQEQ